MKTPLALLLGEELAEEVPNEIPIYDAARDINVISLGGVLRPFVTHSTPCLGTMTRTNAGGEAPDTDAGHVARSEPHYCLGTRTLTKSGGEAGDKD